MRTHIRLLLAAAALAAGGLLTGCKTGTLSGSRVPALYVGVTPDSPPIIFQRNGAIAGIEADLARALGKALDRPIRFVELPWDQQIGALLADRIDVIMSGMTITDERKVRIAFTEPYMLQGQSALVRRQDLDRFDTPQKILAANANFAVQKKTTADMLVQQVCRNASSVGWMNPDEGAQALAARMIDIYIHDTPIIVWLASENEADLTAQPLPTPRQAIAWAVRKTDTDLLAAMNAALADWRKDGTLEQIVGLWLPPAAQAQ